MNIQIITRPATPLLALLAWLLLPQTANCFYNSSTGRWLSRDPIEENGGQSLYAVCSNDCVNKVDPLGLVQLLWRFVLGDFVGYADKYTNPAFYGEGDQDTDYSTYTRSRVRVYSGNWKSGKGTCNTIINSANPEYVNAGAIHVYLTDVCPGKYSVYFSISARISAAGRVGRSSATLTDAQKPPNYFFNDKVTPGDPPLPLNRGIRIDVTVSKRRMAYSSSESDMILRWEPVIALASETPERKSWGEADARIIYLATRRDGQIIDRNLRY